MDRVHPNLLATEELQRQIKQRLPTQNVEDLSRDELLRVYNSFIVPMPSRASSNSQRNGGVFKNFTTASSTNNAKSALVSVDDSNQLKRKINVRTKISNDETVMDDSKRPRVGFHSKEEPSRTTNKRPINDDNYVDQTGSPLHPTKRKKITWP